MRWECLSRDQLFSLMSTFSIVEASALIAGHPPSSYKEQYEDTYGKHTFKGLTNPEENEQTVFDVALQSITSAIEIGELKALIKIEPHMQLYKTDTEEQWQAKAMISIEETRIKRDDLLQWLANRKCYPSFFFNDETIPKYLIREDNPQYSPKLCALVHVWEATKKAEDNEELGSMTIKQFASNWLEENAYHFGVDGVSNYDDMAAMINWNTKGGRVSDKANLEKTKPILPKKSDPIKISTIDEKIALNSDLVIQKNDLKDSPYAFNSSAMDDELPF